MSYRILPLSLDLNDPESRFQLTVNEGTAELRFLDWRARPVCLVFYEVHRAALFRSDGYRELPEGRLLELLESPELGKLVDSGLAVAAEGLRHFVVSSNEEEWAEFVASHYDLRLP